MPNWCHNRVTVDHEDQDKVEYMFKIFTEEDKVFNALIPMPEEYLQGEAWYDWRIDNWGCKWDIRGKDTTVNSDVIGSFEVEFETPWGPPEKICKHLRDIGYSVVWFFDEPGMQSAGYL